jgi:hypothetical protein
MCVVEAFEQSVAALKIFTLTMVGLRFLPCNRITQKPQHMFFSSQRYKLARPVSGGDTGGFIYRGD